VFEWDGFEALRDIGELRVTSCAAQRARMDGSAPKQTCESHASAVTVAT
jgi:hypothetical protein